MVNPQDPESWRAVLDEVRRREHLDAEKVRAWGALLLTHRNLIRLMDADLRRRHGSSITAYDVLRQLALGADSEGMRMTDLADRVVLSRSGLTGQVNRLEQAGLVVRSPSPTDRRSAVVRLTPQGGQQLLELHATHVRGIRDLFTEHLSQDAARSLLQTLGRFAGESDTFAIAPARLTRVPNGPSRDR